MVALLTMVAFLVIFLVAMVIVRALAKLTRNVNRVPVVGGVNRVLGGVLGAARAVLPTRGRAAFLPDMLFVGVALMALQSYAVSQSQAGQLRGYMALAAFCAAGAVQAVLRPLFAEAEALAGRVLLGPVKLAARCIAPWKAARAAAKVRRNEKRLAKKPKKSLPTPPRMLYNSNVSK